MELKLKLVTTSPGGWVDGWTKTKLMLFSTQVEVVVDLKLELSLAWLGSLLAWVGGGGWWWVGGLVD